MSSPLTQESLSEALRTVIDPVFDRPMWDIGAIADVKLVRGVASMRVKVRSPSPREKSTVEERIRAATTLLGPMDLRIDWDVQVPSREIGGDDPVPTARNVILVMSGKGGVGKSSVAANLALALHKLGARVGLLDADIYGPSIPTMFGTNEPPTSDDGKQMTPIERFGIKLMSVGFMLEKPHDAVIWRGPMLHTALGQFLGDVSWGELDFLVLDLPPGTGDVALTLAQRLKSTAALLVTTPQEVALQDVLKGVSMCRKLGISIVGVVENMSYFIDSAGVKQEIFGSGGGQKVAEFAQAPLLAQIPIDPAIRQCGDEGMPVVEKSPDSASTKTFTDLAETLARRIAVSHFERAGARAIPEPEGRKHLKILK